MREQLLGNGVYFSKFLYHWRDRKPSVRPPAEEL
jgi:hypothetical protein